MSIQLVQRPFFLLALIWISSFAAASAQLATINPDSTQTLLKGCYKSYEEFVGNKPSIKDAFSVSPFYLNAKDSLSLIGGMYQPADSSKEAEQVWGFCDGAAVFVTAAPFSSRYYWKLIGLGKYPFFLGKSKSFARINLTTVIAGNVFRAKPRNLALLVITDKGKFKEVTISYMKKILAARPLLLAGFQKEAEPYEQYENPNADLYEPEEAYNDKIKIMTDYLIKLNRSLQ